MTNARQFSTKNDLPAPVREGAITLLNQHLADCTDLYTQTKQAHWNVKGMNFIQLHELFDKLADSVEDYVDLIAERITALGGTALGTARMSASASRLPEYPLDSIDGADHLRALVERFAASASTARAAIAQAADIGDADTADLFTEVSRGFDKHLWFLESHAISPVEAAGNR